MSGYIVHTLVAGVLLVALVPKIIPDVYAILSPLNSVAEVGGQAIFKCGGVATSGRHTYWYLSSDGSTNNLTLAKGCAVVSVFSSNYRTENGTDYCNLIVSNITMQQAGVYTCRNPYYTRMTFKALLTVIDLNTPAKVETNITTNVTEGESVGLKFSMKYNGSMSPYSTLRPILYWTDIDGRNISSSTDYSNANATASTATFAVGRQQDKLQFTCYVYFQLTWDPSNSSNYATNTPNNVYVVNTSLIDAYYAPGDLSICEHGRCVQSIVVTLNCSSSANPPANYKWMDVTNDMDEKVVSETSTFSEAEGNRVYRCTAYNYIRGKLHETSINYAVPHINPDSHKNPSSAKIVIIVLSVLLAISAAVNTIQCILCKWNSSKGLSDKGNVVKEEITNAGKSNTVQSPATYEQLNSAAIQDEIPVVYEKLQSGDS